MAMRSAIKSSLIMSMSDFPSEYWEWLGEQPCRSKSGAPPSWRIAGGDQVGVPAAPRRACSMNSSATAW